MAKASEKGAEQKSGVVLSRRAVAGWVCALFVLSAWMFGMGVMVGRGTAPVHFDIDQLKRTIESLQKAQRELLPVVLDGVVPAIDAAPLE